MLRLLRSLVAFPPRSCSHERGPSADNWASPAESPSGPSHSSPCSAGHFSPPKAGVLLDSARPLRCSRRDPRCHHRRCLASPWLAPGSALVFPVTMMANDALALVATALAEASPGGVPGDQVPALLRAASVLAGLEAPFSRGRRRQSRQLRGPVYRSPPGRVPACLRLRQLHRFRRPHRRPAHPPRSGLRPVPLSPQSPPQPVQTPLQAPVTPSAPPPRSVPEPLVVPSPPVAVPGGWERVRLSRRQRQRQARQAQQQPSSQLPQQQPPPAPQQLHPQPSRPPLSQTPLRHFPLSPRPQPPRPPSSPVPPAPPDVQLFPHVPRDPHVAAHVVATPFHVEQRVMHVGTCLTLLSYVLDQLHVCLARQGVEVGGMLPSEQSAAVSAAREMLHYLPLIGLVQGAPGAALGSGPGAMLRLAESAQGAPLGLVSAAASVLRWMDGRLCWIRSE
ncbi:unnamed protein product [Closterium sp. NIES-64]|nr:unnamed protein product [Closterium sp. NIES-64]